MEKSDAGSLAIAGGSSKVKGGMLEGRKESSERRSTASLGSSLLDVQNRENYIPARAKERKMERWECQQERETLIIQYQ